MSSNTDLFIQNFIIQSGQIDHTSTPISDNNYLSQTTNNYSGDVTNPIITTLTNKGYKWFIELKNNTTSLIELKPWTLQINTYYAKNNQTAPGKISHRLKLENVLSSQYVVGCLKLQSLNSGHPAKLHPRAGSTPMYNNSGTLATGHHCILVKLNFKAYQNYSSTSSYTHIKTNIYGGTADGKMYGSVGHLIEHIAGDELTTNNHGLSSSSRTKVRLRVGNDTAGNEPPIFPTHNSTPTIDGETDYYLEYVDANKFSMYTTLTGGSAITFTQTGPYFYYKKVDSYYGFIQYIPKNIYKLDGTTFKKIMNIHNLNQYYEQSSGKGTTISHLPIDEDNTLNANMIISSTGISEAITTTDDLYILIGMVTNDKIRIGPDGESQTLNSGFRITSISTDGILTRSSHGLSNSTRTVVRLVEDSSFPSASISLSNSTDYYAEYINSDTFKLYTALTGGTLITYSQTTPLFL